MWWCTRVKQCSFICTISAVICLWLHILTVFCVVIIYMWAAHRPSDLPSPSLIKLGSQQLYSNLFEQCHSSFYVYLYSDFLSFLSIICQSMNTFWKQPNWLTVGLQASGAVLDSWSQLKHDLRGSDVSASFAYKWTVHYCPFCYSSCHFSTRFLSFAYSPILVQIQCNSKRIS